MCLCPVAEIHYCITLVQTSMFCLTAQAKQSKVIAIKCLLTFLSVIYHQINPRCSQTESKASTSKGTELCKTTDTTHG